MTISVNEAPIKWPMYDPEGRMHPVWVAFFNQIARVSQGKDTSSVIAASAATATNADSATNADKLDNLHASELPGALVWEHTVSGSAVASVDTSIDDAVTLSGLAHGGYNFEAYFKITGGAYTVYMLANNDTTTTDYYQSFYGVGGSALNAPGITLGLTNQIVIVQGRISVVDGHIFMTGNYIVPDNAGVSMQHWATKQSVSFSDLTRLTFKISTGASGINVGSRVRLWRMK